MWGKMAQKEVRPRILGIPWDPLGTQKSPKSQKNEVQKSIKIQNDLKEPPKADLHRFGVPRSLKKHQKMTPK